jgi:hypothetical protein
MDIILAPDVYVNASVALGSPPEQVVRRVLGKHKGESKTTEWIMKRVEKMLLSLPTFKPDAVEQQVTLIKGFVQVVPTEGEFGPDAWKEALVAAAKAAGVQRVLTDHPDLLQLEAAEGIEFVPSEAWLVEVTTPPPAPPGR